MYSLIDVHLERVFLVPLKHYNFVVDLHGFYIFWWKIHNYPYIDFGRGKRYKKAACDVFGIDMLTSSTPMRYVVYMNCLLTEWWRVRCLGIHLYWVRGMRLHSLTLCFSFRVLPASEILVPFLVKILLSDMVSILSGLIVSDDMTWPTSSHGVKTWFGF